MKVIIAGAGEVGRHVAEVLCEYGHSVTIIDLDASKLRNIGDSLDVRTLQGNCAHFDVLQEAGAAHCGLMIAATQSDEVNLLSASIAKATGASKTIVRVHHTANFSLRGTEYAARIGVDELICPEHLTSLAIARAVRNPGAIVIEEFAAGQLIMQGITVSVDAPAAGRKLPDISLPRGTRVATVERNGKAGVADATAMIEAGDRVTLIGETTEFEQARKQFRKGKSKRIHLTVMGGTTTAVWICRAFKSRLFSVRLFVEQHERARELSEKLPHVTVIEADPTDSATFSEEHIERAETFIAVTDDDERNILACAQAKNLGVETCIAVVQRPKYLHLLPHVGIDHAFSPRIDAVKAIHHLLGIGPVHSLATFAGDVAEVYEVQAVKGSKVLGHELRYTTLPKQTMIAAVRRGDRVYVPGAQDTIQAEDVLLIIGPRGLTGELTALFSRK